MPEPCVALAAAREAATCAGATRPQVKNMAPNCGEILQDASVTDESHSCLAPSLNSLVVAPEWLGCVYEGQQHDREMKCFVDLAKGTSSQFTMREVHGLQLAYCILDDGRMQLLIPQWKGYRE